MSGVNTNTSSLLVLDLLKSVQWNEQGPHSQVLADSEAARLILLTLRAGKEIKEHRNASQLVLQVVDGCIVLTAAAQHVTLRPGMACQLAAGLPHQLRAEQDTVLLLTLTPDPASRGEKDKRP